MGSSDHYAVLTQVELSAAREDAVPRTISLWERADWPSIKHDMVHTDWEVLLVGDAEAKAHALTTKLLSLQQLNVPNTSLVCKPLQGCC